MDSNTNITIKPLTYNPVEFEQIIACMKEARGNKYYSPEFFDPDFLFGDMYDLYGAFYNETIIGIAGATTGLFQDEKSLLAILNVRNGHTGCGVAYKLLSFIADCIRYDGKRSVKVYSVAWHVAVHKILERLGMFPTGLLLGVKDGANFTPPCSAKGSLAVYARNETVRDAGVLFTHKKIADTVCNVYNALGTGFELCTNKAEPGVTSIMHKYVPHDSTLYVQVMHSGRDLGTQINDLCLRYNNIPAFTMTVLLDLTDPTAIYGAEILLSEGFKFCGTDPLGRYENAIFYRGECELMELQMTEMLREFVNRAGFCTM